LRMSITLRAKVRTCSDPHKALRRRRAVEH
jgi:hypothetical protein